MNLNADMDYEILLTDTAKAQAQRILDYIFFQLKNVQAARSVEQDMKETARRLSRVAGSLKFCDDPKLSASGSHVINFKRHKYLML